MKSGVVIVKKEGGMSSQAVVSRVKRIFSADKAGHTGTLDPLATGVLPVLVGRAVKASEFMLTADKYYSATLLLGITTDTEDITGEVLTECETVPSKEEVLSAVSRFVGRIMQTPPMYSALKVGGKKLYELARRGVTVEREPREVTVHSIDVERFSEREYRLDVHCSKGTYIRTLCADIGAALGVGGVMKTLERTRASGYTLEDGYSLSELEAMSEEERTRALLPTEHIFREYKRLVLPDFYARLCGCGQQIYLKKIGLTAELGERFALYNKDGFFAVGEVMEFDEGLAIKPIRQF